MSSYFSPQRKSIFWYNKVALELLLGTSVVNPLLVYNKLSQQKKQILEFRKSLVNSMLNLLPDGQMQQATTSRCKHKLEESQEKLGNNRKKGSVARGAMQNTAEPCHQKKQKLSANKLPLIVLDATTSHICAWNVMIPMPRVNNNYINLDLERYSN